VVGESVNITGKDLFNLLLLGALWGGSFLFIKISVPEFGPVSLVGVRIAIGAVCLLPLICRGQRLAEFRGNWVHTSVLGILNSALPFALISFAVLYLSAGFASIINASAPLWGGLFAMIWLRDKLTLGRAAGLIIGFGGVVVLLWRGLNIDQGGSNFAIPAALLAALSYGLAANYAKKYLDKVSSYTTAAGSLIGTAILLLPGTVWFWPDGAISLKAWAAVIFMSVACTAGANLLYFRLISSSGPTVAISVAYLIPLFAMIFGVVFIDEVVTLRMIIGCGIILFGTGLVTNMIRLPAFEKVS
jgi:drug/metabolite transporter (DMT)-like permease